MVRPSVVHITGNNGPDGIWTVYDRGIHLERPGKSHFGLPEQTLHLGQTSLPMNIIMDYLESMSQIYTAEVCTNSYSELWISLKFCRLMTSGPIIAIISRMILQLFFLGKAFQSISQTCLRLYLIVHLDEWWSLWLTSRLEKQGHMGW